MERGKKRIVGLIPAAGKGTRFAWTLPKEMFPFSSERINEKLYPKPISREIFDLMRYAGARIIYFVINSLKFPIVEYYGNGSRFNLRIGYLVQEEPTGLAHAIGEIDEFVSEEDIILFGMPDTFCRPKNVFNILTRKLLSYNADVCLGLFWVSSPERFGTVILDDNGEFVACEDKPRIPKTHWIWGVMTFKKTFSEISKSLKKADGEVQVADALSMARKKGLKILAHKFRHGEYYDFGTYENLAKYLKLG